ncbi:ABC transporter substrate-binding protein [Pseudonocardia zijingensis]|uniref:ABC transporter substrate-binding protein n=1 Tax=Pseudonocardia zijingensis TaxID=153376 RepID=A0ABN1NKV7_9PSEU
MSALAGLLLLTACGTSAAPGGSEPTPIRVTVANSTEPGVIPWLVGDDQQIFEKHGVAIDDIVAGQGGSTTLRNLVSGGLEVADVGFPAVVDGALAGTPVTAVAGSSRSAYGLDFYALTTSDVRTPADVQRWAFTNPKSVTEALSYLIPRAVGIDPSTIEHIPSGGTGEGIAMLESGAVDVALVPASVAAKETGKYRLVAASADHLPALQQGVLAVRDDYLAVNPTVVGGVVAAFQESVESVRRNPGEAARLYADHVGLAEAQARGIVDAAVRANYWSTGVESVALDNAVQAMEATNGHRAIPWCEIFDLSHLPDGAPNQLPTPCGSPS